MEKDAEALAGRMDALAHFTLFLAARPHRQGMIEAADLIAQTRSFALGRDTGRPLATAACRAGLEGLADRLEAALQSTGHLP